MKEILVHTLNGLPASFNAFHTSIRTRSGTISLEELHILLILEESTIVKLPVIEAIPTTMAVTYTFTLLRTQAARERTKIRQP